METIKLTQHQKILNLCADGEFHCQNAFRELYIFSPHKRREEIEKGKYKGGQYGKYKFLTRKCIHGVSGQFDYRITQNY